MGAASNRQGEQGTQSHCQALDDLHMHLLPTGAGGPCPLITSSTAPSPRREGHRRNYRVSPIELTSARKNYGILRIAALRR